MYVFIYVFVFIICNHTVAWLQVFQAHLNIMHWSIGASFASIISCHVTTPCCVRNTTLANMLLGPENLKMQPILVTKTRPRSLRKTLQAPNLRPQFWDQESDCCMARTSTAWGSLWQRTVTRKFLRLTFPFVFWKFFPRTPTHTACIYI